MFITNKSTSKYKCVTGLVTWGIFRLLNVEGEITDMIVSLSCNWGHS